MVNKKSCIYLVVIIFTMICFLPSLSFADNVEQNVSTYKITGYVTPDFLYSDSTASINKEGFKIEVPETGLSTFTDEHGCYELNVPVYQAVYAIKVSKSNYLEREIKPFVMLSDSNGTFETDVQYKYSPITSNSEINGIIMWPGDIKIDGRQDNVINLLDIMEIAKHFNTTLGSNRFSADADLNCDNSINLTDVMLLAKHFNKSDKDYLDTVSMAKAIEGALNKYFIEARGSVDDTRELFSSIISADEVIESLQQTININGKAYGPYLDPSGIYEPIYLLTNDITIGGWSIFLDCKNNKFYACPDSCDSITLY